MGIGHVAVGIAFKKLDSKTNAAWFVAAALFADLLLWVLIMVGTEQVIVPEDFVTNRYMRFVFPISHGVLASFGWAIIIGLIGFGFFRNVRSAALIGLASLTHLFLDWLVHVAPFQVIGSVTVEGLGLWKNIHLLLVVECLLTVVCLFLYLKSTSAASKLGRYGMIGFILVLMLVMFSGQLFAPMPETATQIASSSMITLIAIVLVVLWLDRKRSSRPLS
ncbi:MAG: hypothetical protein JNM27_00090 [Leptospirales bacterium]|nr:hypothetical protein [Leptospirales bacterium]